MDILDGDDWLLRFSLVLIGRHGHLMWILSLNSANPVHVIIAVRYHGVADSAQLLLVSHGTGFQSKVSNKNLMKWMEIDKLRTSAYQPSMNGAVERFHRTLNTMMGKVCPSHNVIGTNDYPR